MAYELTTEEGEGYFYVFGSSETETAEESIEALQRVAIMCKENGYTRVLLEEDHGTQLSLEEISEISVAMSEMGFDGIRMAFVDRKQEDLAGNLFGEVSATNRGVDIKVFPSVAEAERWLRNSGDQAAPPGSGPTEMPQLFH